MPTYEYECKKCGRIFEEFQSIKARPKRVIPTECEQCDNRAPVTRLIGAGGGVIFKGSGFYETDYRSDSYKKAAKADHERNGEKTDGAKETPASKPERSTKTPATKSSKSDG